MQEKLIVALGTMCITMGIYIVNLPTRGHLAPGLEIVIPFFVLMFWAVGHVIKHEIDQFKEDGEW